MGSRRLKVREETSDNDSPLRPRPARSAWAHPLHQTGHLPGETGRGRLCRAPGPPSQHDVGYPGISDVTRRLFQFWFDEDHLLADGTVWRYWWCQREAIETLIYLVEMRGSADFAPIAQEFGEQPKYGMLEMDFSVETTMDGQRLLRRWVPEVEKDAIQELPEENLQRYAFKMATGAGKTVVMAMAIAWSYFNRRLFPSPTSPPKLGGTGGGQTSPPKLGGTEGGRRGAEGESFADNFLIVAPNVGQWGMKVILRGDSAVPDPAGNLFVVNIQQIYESREEEWTPANALEAVLGRPPKQDLEAYQPSMLERIKGLDNLMVLNDEAHHVHDEDLAWNKTLQALHENLKHKGRQGLTAWLDFSATPKTQAGTYYPWILVDYPLAQAIEDQIVKAPLIVHRVNKPDPKRVTKHNVVQAYHDWIVVALERWKEHTQVYRGVGQKPVLFIMCERTAYADAIAEHIRKAGRLKKKEVLVIHTDSKGNITKKDLDQARNAARDVDKPDSDIKIIVSVLMLREGWDVHNVTVTLGLRPFTSKAAILPEQAVGRGLRVMHGVSPDRRQTLEVIGTEAFEAFVRELEQEGVGIDTVGTPPPLPIKVYPIQERAEFDIAIPLTKPKYTHAYRNLKHLDPSGLPPIYDAGVLAEELAIEIEMAFAITGTTVHQAVVIPERPLLSQDFLRDITHATEGNLKLNGHFAELYRIVKGYVQHRCFGIEVDLDKDDIKRRLRDPMLQDGIATFLSRRIAELTTQERAIEFEDAAFRLSQTQPFTWSRLHLACDKTIFNECAVFNDLEARFAQFLDGASDILRFAALAESYTRFRVDYLSTTGAIKFYYPDFVAVQQTPEGEVNWIVETKGREYEDVTHKDGSIRDWCEKISAQTGQAWRYLKVPQRRFDASDAETFGELVEELDDDRPRLLN